jgi:hypothetical protein
MNWAFHILIKYNTLLNLTNLKKNAGNRNSNPDEQNSLLQENFFSRENCKKSYQLY